MSQSLVQSETTTDPRAMCFRCFRPTMACVCADIQAVDNQTGVIIVQHPRERHHPFGTARFAKLGLSRVDVRVCGPNDAAALARASVLPAGSALLYPSPDAPAAEELTPSERPQHIVVVDATWHHAKTLVRAAPWLQALPKIRLKPAEPSNYRIRREPQPDYLSTIEAIVGTLKALEPETHGLDELLGSFRRMIDRQIEHTRGVSVRRPQKPRVRGPLLPSALTTDFSGLVVAHGELGPQRQAGSRELIYWAAVRPATGEVFSQYIRPKGPAPSDHHLAQLELPRTRITSGQPVEQFLDGWARFVGPRGIVATWTKPSPDPTPPTLESLGLKAVLCNLLRRRCGAAAAYVHENGLSLSPLALDGRAGRQVAYMSSIVQFLHAGGGV